MGTVLSKWGQQVGTVLALPPRILKRQGKNRPHLLRLLKEPSPLAPSRTSRNWGSDMSMRIMDMQVLVQKSTDVAKIQQIQHQENNLRQQEIASHIVENTNKNTQTVNKPLANESKLVHEKQDNEEKHKKNRNKRGNDEIKENKENTEEHPRLDTNRGTNLDILA